MSILFEWHHKIFYDLADPRVRDYKLFGSIAPMTIAYGFYIVIIYKIFPLFMKNREPIIFKHSWILESVLFLNSAFFVVRGWKHWKNYDWRCQPFDNSTSVEALEVKFYFYLNER